jgi:hypothetical protein
MLTTVQPWQPQAPQPPPTQQPQAWTPQLPGALPPPNADDHDLAALSPFWPKVAAALVAVGGLCAVLGSLQTWMTVEIYDDAWQVAPVLDALLGVACIVVATKLVTARRWAAITGLVLSALLVVASGAWCVYALSNRFLAVFIIVAPVMALAGTALAALSIVACDRAERARARLQSQGLDLGL